MTPDPALVAHVQRVMQRQRDRAQEARAGAAAMRRAAVTRRAANRDHVRAQVAAILAAPSASAD